MNYDTLTVVAWQMYGALKLLPCACCKEWRDGKPEQVTTKECRRCGALKAYEALTGAKACEPTTVSGS